MLPDDSIRGRPLVCSWSGGKDSCLALHRAVQAGGVPQALLTMLTEEGRITRSHGLPRAVIEQQAGIDPSGELGEYHTVVTAGPLFTTAIPLRLLDQVGHAGCWLQRVELGE